MEVNIYSVELEAIAKKRVRKIKVFFIHLFVYCFGLTVFVLKKYCNVDFGFFPMYHTNWFLMLVWLFFLSIQGIKLFVREVLLGKNWEKRQLEKIIRSEERNQKWK